MMKRRFGTPARSLKGFSALRIILIIVVILIAAGLGFVVWSNFQQKNDKPATASSTKTVSKPDPNAAALKEAAGDQTLSSGVQLKYPDGWQEAHAADTTSDTNTITSPDGSIVIKLTVAKNVAGGWSVQPEGAVTYVDSTNVAGRDGLSFVLAVGSSSNGSQGLYLAHVTGSTVPTVGSDYVDTSTTDWFTFKADASESDPMAQLTMDFPKLDGQAMSPSQLQSAITSNPYYSMAKSIIASVFTQK